MQIEKSVGIILSSDVKEGEFEIGVNFLKLLKKKNFKILKIKAFNFKKHLN